MENEHPHRNTCCFQDSVPFCGTGRMMYNAMMYNAWWSTAALRSSGRLVVANVAPAVRRSA